ncbi:MAG: hypothetical protein MR038_01635 [Oscillospiraceae bacterium]|nr:hypothetical protein [Oscillospiraceae bacterium]
MSSIGQATLADGRKIPYVITDNPPAGGMKYTYFSPDKSYVVQFFNDPSKVDTNMRSRLEAILTRYNPTLPEGKGGAVGNDEKTAEYFSKRFCWPTDIVVYPEFGIVSPTYPKSFFFGSNASDILDLKGKDKKSNWFTGKNRKYLNPAELGDFHSMLQTALLLSRSIRRLHQAGLAHSDLSNNNVLIDPKSGNCVVIDIDSLVVPGIYPPEVAGTRGYIAPEVVESLELPAGDLNRKAPSAYTDLHALAVLIYEYLLRRHPIIGPKIYSAESAEKDDYLALGPMATFIENPYDTSNRPADLKATIHDLGPELEALFLRAFVDGLHDPDKRPSAMEWERGLVRTWDQMHRCSNPNCDYKWFVLYDPDKPVCPFCGTKIDDTELVQLNFSRHIRGQKGKWRRYSKLLAVNNTPIFGWHIKDNIFPDEKADKQRLGYICNYKGNWFLANEHISGLVSPSGNSVPAGSGSIMISDGTQFLTSNDEHGLLVTVSVKKIK